ncbi:MAG: methionine--tRNA ligase subunit beta, partial [Pseudomonadota bacterium]
QDEVQAFVRSWIDQGLRDWDISRDGPYFGFKIPDFEDKFFYVWLDAPIGYIAATEHYCETHARCTVDEYWTDAASDAEIHHFIGKDISYFHTLFWPAVLKAADYRTPDAVHVHGFLTIDGRKMSKSRGTFITARRFAEALDPSYLRYYYAAKLGQAPHDIDLNTEEFVKRVNAELVNNITNLISRAVGFLNKRLESRLGRIPDDPVTAKNVDEIEKTVELVRKSYEGLQFGQATQHIIHISTLINGYIQDRAPWDLMKDPNGIEQARDLLTFAVNGIKVLTVLLKPIIPSFCARVEEILGVKDLKWEDAAFTSNRLEGDAIGVFSKLMDRLEPTAFEKVLVPVDGETVETPAVSSFQAPEFKDEVTIDDFGRLDLRAGKILKAESVPGSDKLLRLEVELGRATRVIFAGIKGSYAPEELVGLTVAVIANLKPRKMRFGTSEGMVLAGVDASGRVSVCELGSNVPPGTPIK